MKIERWKLEAWHDASTFLPITLVVRMTGHEYDVIIWTRPANCPGIYECSAVYNNFLERLARYAAAYIFPVGCHAPKLDFESGYVQSVAAGTSTLVPRCSNEDRTITLDTKKLLSQIESIWKTKSW